MTPDWTALIDRYLDGCASAEEVRALDAALRSDLAVQQALWERSAEESSLVEAFRSGSPALSGERTSRYVWWSSRVLRIAAVWLLALGGWALAAVSAYRYHIVADGQASLSTAGPPEARVGSGADRIIEKRGLVLLLSEGEGKPIPLSVGATVPVGRSLWTCPWGAADLRLHDGASVQIDRSTVVGLCEGGGGREMVVRKGIVFLTKQGPHRTGTTTIRTDHAVTRVGDAQVAVAAEDRRTIVEVAEGEVEVLDAAGNQPRRVTAGSYAIVTPGAPTEVHSGRLVWRLEPAN